MARSRLFLALSCAALVALGGCGFTPMYAERERADAVTGLAQTDVEPATSRIGQLVRNELLRNTPPAQTGGAPFVLSLQATESVDTELSSPNSDMRQHRLRVRAAYTLKDRRSGRRLTEGKTFADATYTETRQHFADVNARMQAERAAARQVAEDIRTRLAAWFARH